MDKRFEILLNWILLNDITDVHFVIDENISIEGRNGSKFITFDSNIEDLRLFHYLKYMANLDLTDNAKPQSGSFEYTYHHLNYSFRFAIISTNSVISGVLRILNFKNPIPLDKLVLKGKQREIFKKWTTYEYGLIVIGGPTGAGKTTTAYSILGSMKNKKIYTLEDPIEVNHNEMVQIQINPSIGLNYAEGIKQLLRHDPDVIMIGEIRDEDTAKMALRSALTGHLVITTIHASSCIGTIQRLNELGISNFDLKDILYGITNQRLVTLTNQKKSSIYEIYDKQDINDYFNNPNKYKGQFIKEIKYALNKGWISNNEAKKYLH